MQKSETKSKQKNGKNINVYFVQNAIFSWVFTIEYYICSMKIILYILLGLVSVFLLWIVGIFIHTFYRLATGKMSKEEQDFHLRQYEKMKKERKAKKRKSSSFSYPSPLNEMFWP